jgi:alpha-galactosidase
MVETMDFLRKLAGNKCILGCGVPLGAALGQVDICRIGPDVGHEWTNTLTRGLAMRETISTVTALENAIGRMHLSGRTFSNDPDVFFLRDLTFAGQKFDPFVAFQELRWGKRTPLSSKEKYTLFLLNNVLGRLVFTSDDIQEYSEETFALYASSFPLREKDDMRVRLLGPAPAFGEIGGFYELRFRIGHLQYWVYANLANETVFVDLPVSGFSWNEKFVGTFHQAGETLTLEPHSAVCLLEETAGEIGLVGSESHLFPGSDLVEWSCNSDEEITFVRDKRARGSGRIFFKIPANKSGIRINGQFIAAQSAEVNSSPQTSNHVIVVQGDSAKGDRS